jgi:hypothetical protein
MYGCKSVLMLGFAGVLARSGDVPPPPVSKQMEEFALKERREGSPSYGL